MEKKDVQRIAIMSSTLLLVLVLAFFATILFQSGHQSWGLVLYFLSIFISFMAGNKLIH